MGTTKKAIRITCDTKLRIPYNDLNGIQGALKTLTKENFEKLKKHILEDGVNFAMHVWKEAKGKKVKWWIIDGHGRHAVLKFLIEEEKYECAGLPCVEIEAKTFKQAKRKVLNASSSFHTTTDKGLFEFMTDIGMDFKSLVEGFEIPEINLPEFNMEFFEKKTEEEVTQEPEKETVTFDAYKNAAIKQVVLYFAAKDYEVVIPSLDKLMEKMKCEDYSQVVWRLISEAIRT